MTTNSFAPYVAQCRNCQREITYRPSTTGEASAPGLHVRCAGCRTTNWAEKADSA